jgi:hypothetical protein
MLSMVTERNRTGSPHHGYEKDRYVDRIGSMRCMKESSLCLTSENVTKSSPTKSSDDLLEEEIRMALIEERSQRGPTPRSRAFHRSNSVNMYQRSMLPSFDSERRLHHHDDDAAAAPLTTSSDLLARTAGSWNTMDSIHSRMDETRRQWHDSIHSRVSTALPTNSMKMSIGNSTASSTPSYSDMEDSTCSFASFGNGPDDIGTNGSLHDDSNVESSSNAQMESIRLASQTFTSLNDEILPVAPSSQHGMHMGNRSTTLMKQQSMRLKRGPSFRGSLSLIQESTF